MKVIHIQKVKGLAGSEKYFLSLLPSLQENEIECVFICVYTVKDKNKVIPFIHALEEKGIKVIALKYRNNLNTIQLLNSLKSSIKKEVPDIIHTHLIHADFWVALLKKFFKIKSTWVSTKHGYDEQFLANYGLDANHIKKNRYYKIQKFADKHVDRAFAVSKGLKHFFIDSGIISDKKIDVIYHGIHKVRINKNEKNYTKDFTNKKYILIVGRLIPSKGQHHVINIANDILNDHNIDILFIGDSKDESYKISLKNLVQDKGLEKNIKFIGHLNENLNTLYKNAELTIVPSYGEGFGLVALESIANGTPSIGFDVTATNEIIENGVNGFTVPLKNEQELKDKTLLLLKDQKLRDKFSKNCFIKVEKDFSYTTTVTKTIEFYHRVLTP